MTLQLLVYADNVNLVGGNTNAVNKNKAALIDASRKTGPEADKDNCIYIC
jgi:hypothetical protein